MSLWALRHAILGNGAWLIVGSEEKLERLQNSPRQRKPAEILDLNEINYLF
jgi:hypothetical protein